MPEVITSSTVGRTAFGPNLSLLKGGTISQTIVGLIVSASVVASLVVTIVMISVGAGVQNPTLKPDYYELYKKTPSKLYPLLNDIDPRGGNLTILNVTQPLHGKAVLSSAGMVIYTSIGSYAGNDTFEYSVTNGWTTATEHVYLSILNRAPEVVDMTYTVNKNSKKNSFDLFGYESEMGAKIKDIDGDDLSITDIILVSPNVGSLISFDQNYLYYTPAYGFNNIELLNYTISDGYANVSGVITINVANDKPTAEPDTYTITKNALGTFNILDNDFDINGDNISITTAGLGSSGVVLISSDNSNIEYIPKPFVAPYTDAFEYEITDGALTSSSYVFVKIVNSPPTVSDKVFNVAKNSKNNLLDLTFSDPDVLDTVTLTAVSKLARGNSSLSVTSSMASVYYPTGDFLQVKKNLYSLVYTPDQGVIYTDSFKVKVSDGVDVAYATITINVVPSPPVPVNDTVTCQKNGQVSLDVISNDYSASGDVLKLNFASSTSNFGGKLVKIDDNNVKYEPAKGFLGQDEAQYIVINTNTDGSSEGTFNREGYVLVNVVNSPPVAVPLTLTVSKGLTSALNLLRDSYDPNGDSINYNSIAKSTYGVSLSFTSGNANVNYAALSSVYVDYVDFTVVDIDGAISQVATATINVVNDAPVPVDDTAAVSWNRIIIPVLTYASDIDGDSLHVESFTQGSKGSVSRVTLTDGTDGLQFTTSGSNNYVGSDSFTFVVSDYGKSSVGISNGYTKNAISFFNVTDIDSQDSVTVKDATVGSCGSVSKTSSTVTFTSNKGSVGVCTVTITFTDGLLNSVSKWNVNVQNQDPSAAPISTTVHWSKSQAIIDIMSTLSDADNDALSYSVSSYDSTFGSPSINSDKALVWTLPQTPKLGTTQIVISFTDGWVSKTASYPLIVQNVAPTAVAKTISSKWSACLSGITIDILSECSDNDGDSLSFDSTTPIVTAPAQGSASIVSSKVYYKQSTASVGSYSITYKITDGIQTSSNSITVNCTFVKYTLKKPPTLSDKTFTYKAFDGALYSSAATVTVKVVNANKPQISDQSTTAHWRTVKDGVSYTVYDTLTDADGDYYSLSFGSGSSAYCSLIDLSNGIKGVKYTRNAFDSTDSCKVVLSDGFSTSAATLTTNSYNNVPVAANFTLDYSGGNIQYGISIDVLSSATDADIQDVPFLSILSVGNSKLYGSEAANIVNGQVFYFPDQSLVKALGTDTVAYTISDGLSTSIGYLTINIKSTSPSSTEQYYNVHFRYSSVGYVFTPLTKIADATKLDTTVVQGSEPNQGGSVVVSSVDEKTVTYKPSGSYLGNEIFKLNVSLSGDKKSFTFTNVAGNVATQTFTYVVSDGKDTSASKTVTISITNNAPSATPITISKHWATVQGGLDINLLSVVTDSDGDSLSITSFTQTNNGAVSSINSTSVKYIPTPLTAGFTTSFTYSVYDGYTTISNTVTISITNTPPVAVDDTITVHWTNNTLYLKPVVNDYDLDNDYIYINKLYPSQFMNAYASMGNYIIISKGTTIVNNFASVVVPGSVATAGFVNQVLQPTGSLNVNNAAQLAIVNAATNLYQSLSLYTCTASLDQSFPSSNVLSFSPGVYCFPQGLSGSGTILLSGSGLYIFSISTNLNANFQWSFTNGASASNVYWLVGAAGISGTFYGHVLSNGQLNFNNVVQNGVIMSLGSNSMSLNSVTFGSVVIPTGQTALELQSDKLTVYYKNTFINGPATDSFQYTITDQIATSNVAIVKLVFTNTAPVATSFSAGKVTWKNTLTTASVVSKYCSDADKDSLSLFGVTQGKYGTTTVTDSTSGTIVYTPSSSISYTSVDSNGASYVTDQITFGCYDGAQVTYNTFSVVVYNTAPKSASKSLSVQRDTSNPTVTLNDLLVGATDAEGDSISVSSVSMISQNTGASVLLSSNTAKLTYITSYLGSIVFSFTLTDGQLSSTYNYNVTITGAPFYCVDYTISTTKDSSAVTFETDLKSKLSSYCVNDVCTLALASTASLNGVGSIAANGNNLLTYTQNSKSSSNGESYSTYSYSNRAGQSAICKIIINQPNNAPTVYDYTYSYSISRASNDYVTFDYVSLSSSDDPDASDSIVLSSISSVGTCTTSSISSLSITSDNQIKFLRNPSFIGSCSFSLVVSDSDLRNPISKTAKITINAISSPPVAVNDAVSTTYNTYIDIPVSTLLGNDYDSLGGTFSFTGINCPTGDSTYCTAGTPTILNPSDPANTRIIRVQPIKGSCNSQKFVYGIKSDSDSTTATAIVTVSYTKCTCSLNMDIVFVLDGSSSIDAGNWINMQNFASNLTVGFGSNISPTATKIGIIQFSTTTVTHLDLKDGTSKTAVLNAISSAGQLKSSTNSILGINNAVSMVLSQGRKDITRKLLIHITDGMSNLPCGMGACRAMYGSDKSLYGSVPNYCKSPRFPGTDATICSWNEPLSRCNPCSDATLRSTDLNSWTVGGASNPEKSTYGSIWNWRQLVVGIGDGLSSGYGQLQIQKMNYDPNNLIVVDWSDLSSVYQTVIDNSCNLVDSTQTNVLVPLSSSGYSIQYLGKTLSKSSYLNYEATISTFTYRVSVSSSAPALQRFTLGLQPGYNQDNFVNYDPYFPVFIGQDTTTNLNGFTFLSLPNSYTIAAGSSDTYTLSIAGDIPEGVITYGMSGGSQYTQGTVKGPSGVINSTTVALPPNINYGDDSSYRTTYCSSTKCYFFTKMNYAYRIEAMSKICKYWSANATLVQIQSSTEKTTLINNVLPYDESATFFLGTKDSDIAVGSTTTWQDGTSMSSYTNYQSKQPGSYTIIYASYNANSPTGTWWKGGSYDTNTQYLLCQFKK
ncbi:predicted protein [Naegleria gruberi]|uniref:Predicted protein n=1 Tax=Naegleria gruberi TaxID=5762 RepID=D2VUR0_NAEGR|nr:uncharacterized protein NAEGRDRAFT_72752 [Naegleria gruberi]EFC39496.1 predicted protein [Naegleria gruberi]|eukprot:XP_002672240.1 predicted protein [Naegleria gruberi strain NEG-M]